MEANTDIQTRLLKLVSEQLSIKDVRPEHRLGRDLGADSLDITELIMAVEEAFTVEVPEATADGFKTVQDIIFFLEQYGRNR